MSELAADIAMKLYHLLNAVAPTDRTNDEQELIYTLTSYLMGKGIFL